MASSVSILAGPSPTSVPRFGSGQIAPSLSSAVRRCVALPLTPASLPGPMYNQARVHLERAFATPSPQPQTNPQAPPDAASLYSHTVPALFLSPEYSNPLFRSSPPHQGTFSPHPAKPARQPRFAPSLEARLAPACAPSRLLHPNNPALA